MSVQRYYGDWENYDQMCESTQYPLLRDSDVVYACYRWDSDYEGEALIIFTKDGCLYENLDSHCSCMGLENWGPEETSLPALRLSTGWVGLDAALDHYEETTK